MGTHAELDTEWIEEKVARLFSPNGSMTVVILVILSAILFSGSGLEHRTTDGSGTDDQPAAVSPILGTP